MIVISAKVCGFNTFNGILLNTFNSFTLKKCSFDKIHFFYFTN